MPGLCDSPNLAAKMLPLHGCCDICCIYFYVSIYSYIHNDAAALDHQVVLAIEFRNSLISVTCLCAETLTQGRVRWSAVN